MESTAAKARRARATAGPHAADRTGAAAAGEMQRRTAPPATIAVAVRVGAGLVLVAAAVLKARALSLSVEDRLWTMLHAQAELGLGLWLVSGLWPRAARGVGLVAFSAFAAVALVQWLRGAESCGCFGRVAVPPWATLALDLAIVAGLAVVRPRHRPATPPEPIGRTRPLAVAWCIAWAVAASALVWLALPRMAQIDPDGQIAGDAGSPVVLEPETWPGRPLPILGHLEGASADELSSGEWSVLLYHRGCPACEEALDEMVLHAKASIDGGADRRRALIEVGAETDHPIDVPEPIARFRLSADRQWFVRTPVWLELRDGVVIDQRADADPPGMRVDAVAAAPDAGAPVVVAVRSAPPRADLLVADLGYVPQGGVKRVRVRVNNPTAEPLDVRQVVSECSCIVVTDAPARLPAQGDALVGVRFEAPDEVGPYQKPLIVVFEDPEQPARRVMVRVRVGMPLSVEPASLKAGQVADGTAELTVRNDHTEPVRLLYATSSVPGVTIKVPREAVPAGGALELRVERADGQSAPPSGQLRIHTASPAQPVLEIAFE